MNKEEIKKVVIDQNGIKEKNALVFRDLEIGIKKNKKVKQVLIISGIRRCGKSTLLNKIRTSNKENNYYLNFDDERLITFSVADFQKLYEIFLELYDEQSIFYFDEIQNISNWERFIRRIYDEGYKVYITGSNASMLSRELGTHLTGRHIAKELYPFSFTEFLRFKKRKIRSIDNLSTKERVAVKKDFNEYLKKGGFPEYLKSNNKEYLKSLYESIIYRDIIVRYNLNNEKQIKELVYYAASNIGTELSFNSLKSVIGVSNATTVKEYFTYLENSFLFFLLPRFSYSLKKQIFYNKKLYVIDNAIPEIVGFKFSENYGRMMENLVFLELKRRNKDIYYHQGKSECDFIVKKGSKITEAIQVAKSLEDTKCKEREYKGILEAMTEYDLKQGLVLTEDEESSEKIDGKTIQVLPTWKWLIGSIENFE